MSDEPKVVSQEDEAAAKAAAYADRVDVNGNPVVVPEVKTEDTKEPEKKVEGEEETKPDEEDDKTSDDDAKDDDKEWAKAWIKTGHEACDAAIELMEKAGVTPIEGNAIFEKAISANDLSLVDWKLLEAKLGKGTTMLVKQGVEQYYDEVYKEQVATTQAAYEAVGGEKNWEKVSKWSKALRKTDKEWDAKVGNFQKAIDVGGATAAWAIAQIKEAYEADPKNSGLGVAKVQVGDKKVNKGSAGEPLNRSQYVAEMQKLENYTGKDRDAKIAALRMRREDGRNQGM